ncbi:MAG: PEP-CTERM sorting domain-containing protein [Planctomycetota bacterium]
MKTHTKTLLTALITCTAVGAIEAATIQYLFEGGAAGPSNNLNVAATSNDFGSGITASDWNVVTGDGTNRPARVQPTADQSPFSNHTSAFLIVEKGGATDTHTFTITIPDLGSAFVNLTNLSFDFGEVGPDDGAPTWTISSDLGGGTITPNTANGAGTGNFNTDSASLALAGSFSGLNNTSVTFTLTDAAGGNNNNNTWGTWIDNVTLTGEVVPEPGSLALLGLGGLLVASRRRRG